MSSVILMLRTYAFSGRKKAVLALLSIAFFGLVGVIIWVISKELICSSPDILHRGVFLTHRSNRSVALLPYRQSWWLFCRFRYIDWECTTGGGSQCTREWRFSADPHWLSRGSTSTALLWCACLTILTRDNFFSQLISVRRHLSFIITFGQNELLLGSHDRFRLHQHVFRDSGESDDRCVVHVKDDHCKPYSTAFCAVPSAL